MSDSPPRRVPPRAQPVTHAPVDALLQRADELARGWAIALILMRPLERIGELPLERLSREGPALCAQAVRALASDVELERMAAGAVDGREDSASARGLGALAGARDAESAVEAVEALRGVLWEASLDELRLPLFDRTRARRVAELADRLAYVCATALAVTVTATVEAAPAASDHVGFGPPGSEQAMSGSPGAPGARRPAVLVDEREEASAAGYSVIDRPAIASEAPGSSPGRGARARPLPWDKPFSGLGERGQISQPPTHPFGGDVPVAPADPTAATLSRTVAGGGPTGGGDPAPRTPEEPEINIRDERSEEGAPAWIGSISRELERFGRDQRPFAVLLIELGDVERLRRAAPPAEMVSLTSQVERVLGEGLQLIAGSAGGRGRRAGWLTCERPGRYWLLAPETDVFVARRLAEWVARAVRPLASRRWMPMGVTIGMAVCPDDGREATALAAYADAALSVA